MLRVDRQRSRYVPPRVQRLFNLRTDHRLKALHQSLSLSEGTPLGSVSGLGCPRSARRSTALPIRRSSDQCCFAGTVLSQRRQERELGRNGAVGSPSRESPRPPATENEGGTDDADRPDVPLQRTDIPDSCIRAGPRASSRPARHTHTHTGPAPLPVAVEHLEAHGCPPSRVQQGVVPARGLPQLGIRPLYLSPRRLLMVAKILLRFLSTSFRNPSCSSTS